MSDGSYCIYVPKTKEAICYAAYGKWEQKDLYVWQLTEQEFRSLRESGAFELFNKFFGTIIHERESDEVFYQPLDFCKQELYEKFKECECQKEIVRLKKMITYAIEKKTLISFMF